MNIGIVTLPIYKSGVTPLSHIISICHSLSDNVYVITGNEGVILQNKYDSVDEVHVCLIGHITWANSFIRVGAYIYTQLKISCELSKLSRNVDMWIFFGGGGLLLPMLTSKLFRKNVVLLLTASPVKCSAFQNDPLSKLLDFTIRSTYNLSKYTVVYSQNLIKELNLTNHKYQILVAHEHFLDFNKFKLKRNFDKRDGLVGYVGRLSEEKGALNFVSAILRISRKMNDVEFLIGGDGRLRMEIEKYLNEINLDGNVKLLGWISQDELPDHFNQLKLLVLPSYTEGLPNVMLEAMACGTPVLATPVGAIPDVIKDGETGFLMENNSPECIATNVIRALEYPDLEGVAQRARALVEREFTYEKAVERWKVILEEVSDDGGR